jgi:glyoxylase-like metal-dependent hydrolase (beta-lactamase superfamily II)
LAPIKLLGNTYVEKGSPATLLFIQEGTVYVIDPGQGEDRPRRLTKDLKELGASQVIVLLTHYHSDHVEAVAALSPAEVVASSLDAPMIERPELRVLMTFDYPLNPVDPLLPYRAVPARVTQALPEGVDRYGPIEVYWLPGHTEGHLGFATPDGVLYVGDALFGDKVLEKFGIPYHKMPCKALETLRKLGSLLGKYEYVVPGHGPIVKGGEAGPLIDINERRVQEFIEGVRGSLRSPSSVDEVLRAVCQGLKASCTPENSMLIGASIKGLIRCLRDEGVLEPDLSEGTLRWRLKPS